VIWKVSRLHVFLTFFSCLFSSFVHLFSSSRILCFCIVLCVVAPSAYSCLFPIIIQAYRPLPPGGNRIAGNKYHHHHHHHHQHQINFICLCTKFQLRMLCTEQFVSMALPNQTNVNFDTFYSRRLYVSDFIRLEHCYSRLVFHPEELLRRRLQTRKQGGS
jgi:hypothetical protein